MNGKYKEDYLQFIAEAVNDDDQITGLVQNYLHKNNYEDSKDWYKAHALCQLSYQIGVLDEDTEKLFYQIMEKDTMLRSSENLNELDYEEWFGVTKRLNDIFINLGYKRVNQFQYNLLSTARDGFLDIDAANKYLTKEI
ncbi:hypothetical protein [Myroides guanonis]|uniref:DNA phosphorothioation-dependent restriction protein DptG n=1 Tax=Myroides guanonis TaxID=1150112 RepID=A0A1I3Q5K0_9FLAO|nr:hypothetical protein [Myroides guanonis]SFJ29253.1 DNA phosphorothioation-dependent restriction protein DptG [Myroides guanonis]